MQVVDPNLYMWHMVSHKLLNICKHQKQLLFDSVIYENR